MLARDGLEPHRLPDPARGRVEDPTSGSRDLLADGFAGGTDRVVVAHHQLVGSAWLQIARDVERERVVIALVGARQAAVHIHVRLPGDRAEVELNLAATPGGWNRELTPVPPPGVLALDTRQRRLRRERDQDRLREVLAEGGLLPGLCLLVLPSAVEAQPARALELRTRIVGKWRRRRNRARPWGEQRREPLGVWRGGGGGRRHRSRQHSRQRDRAEYVGNRSGEHRGDSSDRSCGSADLQRVSDGLPRFSNLSVHFPRTTAGCRLKRA